jgi:hypothetical protein
VGGEIESNYQKDHSADGQKAHLQINVS